MPGLALGDILSALVVDKDIWHQIVKGFAERDRRHIDGVGFRAFLVWDGACVSVSIRRLQP